MSEIFLDAAVPEVIETSGGSLFFVIILAVIVAAVGTLIWVKTKKAHDSREERKNKEDDKEPGK